MESLRVRVNQDFTSGFTVEKIRNDKQLLLSHGFGDELLIDKDGAAQLVILLMEFLNEK